MTQFLELYWQWLAGAAVVSLLVLWAFCVMVADDDEEWT